MENIKHQKVLVVIPVYNEELIIKNSIDKLNSFFANDFLGNEYKIVLSDNNSSDNTKDIIMENIKDLCNFDYYYISQLGKGGAIRSAWEKYKDDYDLFMFFDADLSTDLAAVNIAYSSGNDLTIGDRYHKNSNVVRRKRRLLVSLAYRMLIQKVLNTKISDFPCGFKAVKRDIVLSILPLVKNITWFFDSELVYLAERRGYSINQIPVNWIDTRSTNNKSKVSILKVSLEYWKEILRIKNTK